MLDNINIFNEQYTDDIIFTELINSTCSIQAKLSNVKFKEEDLIHDLYCEKNIVAIDCNYGHIRLRFYKSPTKNKTSNRGRKKKEIKKKPRKNQGDGTCFGSQISFVIVIDVERKKPEKLDKYSNTAITIDDQYESIFKEYKIKLFRTGVIGIPGVIKEDYSDAKEVIGMLVGYLNKIMYKSKNIIQVLDVFPVMKNYKFRLLENKRTDIRQFHYYCNNHLTNLYNTNFSDIFEFLTLPIMEGQNSNRTSWNRHLDKTKFSINWDKFYPFLDRIASPKNIYINKSDLLTNLKHENLEYIYISVISYIRELRNHFLNFDDRIIKAIMRIKLAPIIFNMQEKFKDKENNSLSSIQYDKENYPGFLIKITTPTPTKPEKKTTIKIFPSGKINIDGARDRETARQIYLWLNNIFTMHPEFIYSENYIHDQSDSDFSEDPSAD